MQMTNQTYGYAVQLAQEQKEAVREMWLSEYSATNEDVFVNTAGDEFIQVEEGGDFKELYLPTHLQSNFINF